MNLGLTIRLGSCSSFFLLVFNLIFSSCFHLCSCDGFEFLVAA